MVTKLKWHTDKRKVNDLIPFEDNPRKINEKQKEDLKKSLEKFNLVEIPAIDTDNKIVAGHQRLKIMQLIGRGDEVIDVRMPNRKLTKEEFKEYLLRSNKNTGEWDYDLLANFGEDELLDVGFDSEELDKIFQSDVEEDEVSELPKHPVSKLGDLYQLGEHRLICGDATIKEDLEKLTQGNLARLIFTDPPYNVDYKSPGGLSYDSKKFGGSGGKIFNDKKSDKECLEFYSSVLRNLYDFSTDDVSIYWWYASKNDYLNRKSFLENKWHISQDIIWVKNGPIYSRGQDYHRMYEPCMMGWKSGKKHYTNKTINNLREVFNLDFSDFLEMLDAWFEKRDATQKYLHPTQKPVRLAVRAIKKNSQRGDIVLDLFGGSGSTLMACEQMERRAFLMELDPKYTDVIIQRWEKFTGKQAKKLIGN